MNKLAYDLKVPFTTRHVSQWGDPRRGDVVVCFSPKDGTRLVKRTVGVPGDVIAMQNNVVLLNGKPLHYQVADAAPFKREVFEDPKPVLARETLGETPHWVMALPGWRVSRSFAPLTVPPGEYFLMGDSRDNSADSRYMGTVKRDQIVGKATGVIVSFDLHRFLLPRIQRFLSPLDSKGS